MRQRMETCIENSLGSWSQAHNSKYNSASSAQSSAAKTNGASSYSKPGGSAPSSEMSSAASDRSRGSARASSGRWRRRIQSRWWRRLWVVVEAGGLQEEDDNYKSKKTLSMNTRNLLSDSEKFTDELVLKQAERIMLQPPFVSSDILRRFLNYIYQ